MEIFDIPKEFCQINDRKEIGQTITLTGLSLSLCLSLIILQSNVWIYFRSLFSIGIKSFIVSLCNKNTSCSNQQWFNQFCWIRRRISLSLSSINRCFWCSIVSKQTNCFTSSYNIDAFDSRFSSSYCYDLCTKYWIEVQISSLFDLLFSIVFLIVFRVDEEGKTKTGVLCGLGANPITNTSLYPDHDMDIAFDVQITTEDLVRVCLIRCLSVFCFDTFLFLLIRSMKYVNKWI